MAKREPLPFLKGTFSWSKLGFFYAAPPPVDLLSPEALDLGNPWLHVAAVLEHAKCGDFSLIPRLRHWFPIADEGHLDRISIILTGDAGREADVRALKLLMEQGPDALRTYACEAAAQAGYLWQVPAMLEAWGHVGNVADHETIGYAITNLLEATGGPIAEEAGTFNLDPAVIANTKDPELRLLLQRVADARPPVPEFEVLVRSRLAEMIEQFGSDDVVVWHGERFDVRRLAEMLHGWATGPDLPVMSFINERHRFEAVTGINCSAFFRENRFQPLAVADIMESFLESPDADRFEPGTRYFFGHRIPD